MYNEEALDTESAAKPDDMAFTDLFHTEYRTVYRYFYYRTGCADLSEDLCQETFVRAYRAFSRFDPARATAATWLLTIARRLYIDQWRRTKNRVYADMEVPESVIGEDSPETNLCRHETHAALYRAMCALSDRERNLIALKYASGMRNREIAVILGKSERHTAVLLCRTLEKLKKNLQKMGVYEP